MIARFLVLVALCYGSKYESDVTARGVARARTEAYAHQLAVCSSTDDGKRQCGLRDRIYVTDNNLKDECVLDGDDWSCVIEYCGHCEER